MDETIKQALQAMAGQPPHKADYSRRQFIANAARYGLTAAAAATLTSPFAFPVAALAADVELPKINSIPDKLKGSGTVRICSYGGALQDAQRKAYFKPFEELSGIKVIEAEGPDPAKVKAMVDSKNIEYDVTEVDGADVINLQKQGEYFEPIDYSLFDVDNIDPVVPPEALRQHAAVCADFRLSHGRVQREGAEGQQGPLGHDQLPRPSLPAIGRERIER